jgi:hypothetical protein
MLTNHHDGRHGNDFMCMGSKIQKPGTSEFGLHYPTAQAVALLGC